MKSNLATQFALSVLAILPAIALSAHAESGATDSQGCRSARRTAELVQQMQMSDGGIPFAIPSECERSTVARKSEQAKQEPKRGTTDVLNMETLASLVNTRSPG